MITGSSKDLQLYWKVWPGEIAYNYNMIRNISKMELDLNPQMANFNSYMALRLQKRNKTTSE